MYAALTMLGYETYHGFKTFADIRDYEICNLAHETKFLSKPSSMCPKVDKGFFDKVLGHMNAVTDMPAVSFSEELIAAYPEAKVVLVERDIEPWYKSFERVFINNYESGLFAFVAWLDPRKTGLLNTALRNSVARCQFRANNSEEFRANAQPVYREHYAKIRKLLEDQGETETRLLEFDLSPGWEPLCKFLGKNVPKDQPFPRVNEDKMIQEKIMVMLLHGLRKRARSMLAVVGCFVAVMVAWWLWRSTR